MRTLWLVLAALALPACASAPRYASDAPYAGPPLARDEMERLAAAGISEPVLVELVQKRGATPLSADDLVALKNADTPDGVVQKMIALERKEPEIRYDARYAYGPYYYSPFYDPWYWSFGAGWGWGWGAGWGWGWGRRSYHPRGSVGVRIYR
jgi:hypothetical protein